MKTFLFTSSDSDNDPQVVQAKDKEAAYMIVAISSLDKTFVENEKDDEPGLSNEFAVMRAIDNEVKFLKDVYDVEEISITNQNNIKGLRKNMGKYFNTVNEILSKL